MGRDKLGRERRARKVSGEWRGGGDDIRGERWVYTGERERKREKVREKGKGRRGQRRKEKFREEMRSGKIDEQLEGREVRCEKERKDRKKETR